MILIGITGAIGHGKTSLAEAFLATEPTAVHDESSILISEFANMSKQSLPLKATAKQINDWVLTLPPYINRLLHVNVSSETLPKASEDNLQSADFIKLVDYINQCFINSKLLTQKITVENKSDHRAILQWLGGYFVNHIKRTIWYDELIRRSKRAESQGCKLYVIGGLRFPEDAEVIRKAGGIVINIQRPNFGESDIADPTERERLNIICDIRVINNRSLDELLFVAKQIIEDITNNEVQKVYDVSYT